MALVPRKIKGFGWKRSLPDQRDIHFTASAPVTLPPKVDLEPLCPSVYDQGNLGSCTANALAGAFEFDLKKQGLVDWMPSRLFIYYNERVIEGNIKSDSGAELRDGMKVLNQIGTCDENEWAYIISKFAVKPKRSCYTIAKRHIVPCYSAIDNGSLYLMQQCLAKGFPFVYGFAVYESFESQETAETGILTIPLLTETVIGGHAVLCVGYDNETKMFKVRNSWGKDWGKGGYFFVPYEYMMNKNLTSDLWTITSVN